MLFLATELPALQSGLLTEPLTGRQWLACIGLALLVPIVIEGSKWLRRRNAPTAAAGLDVEAVVTGSRKAVTA
jgi:Ca2+-transporting ATPase